VAERGSLVRLQDEYELDLDWVGYELHPETPPGGVPLSEYLPDPDGMHRYLRAFAARFGVSLVPPARLVNTRRAHAAAQRARDLGKLDGFRAAAYDAYWREGRGLEADEDLAAVGAASGLGAAEALAAAVDPAALGRVDAARREARRAGVTGVPTFVFVPEGGEQAGDRAPARVVGCQPYDVLADAARRAGARRR
jgi:predicted DsbA family dithiol-disulfide isomerase